jgi:hypothetical protein
MADNNLFYRLIVAPVSVAYKGVYGLYERITIFESIHLCGGLGESEVIEYNRCKQ